MKETSIIFDKVGKKYFLGKKKQTSIVGTLNDIGKKVIKQDNIENAEVWALKNISFSVSKGEVIGLIGRNGAGKTTLLKLLSRITEPTMGTIQFNGRVSAVLEIGAGFHLELSGRDNIFLNGSILGMSRKEIKDQYDEIVSFSGVGDYIHQPIKHYSSGMYVRLAFAVAAHLSSEILLIDEILAVGDAEFQQKCLGKMDAAARSGRTLIIVSHNMGIIRQLCTKVLLIENGCILYNGEVGTAIDKYFSLNQTVPDASIISGHFEQGDITIEYVQLNKFNKPKQHLFQSGSSLEVEISFKTKRIFRDISISLQFCDALNQPVFTCNNYYSSDYFILENEGKLECKIPKLPLTAGKYYVHIKIFQLENQILKKNFVTQFEVVDGDFFSTGRLVPYKYQFLCENHWKQIKK